MPHHLGSNTITHLLVLWANSIGKYNDVYNKTNAVADEFIDSANLLSANRNFLAEEAVAMMLANPANSGFTIPGGSVNCVDDVKDMLDAIIWNLQYGGNNRVWDAAELYIDRSGALEHITGQVTETLEVFANVKTLAADVIRNNTITLLVPTESLRCLITALLLKRMSAQL